MTKGNGDAFIHAERHTSLSVGGGQAGQGFPCVMTLSPTFTLQDREEKPGGGKGPLIQKDVSASLRTNNFQTLFAPIILDDQGGNQINIKTDGKSPALRAQMRHHEPIVMENALAFDGYNGEVDVNASTLGVNCGLSTGRNGILEPHTDCDPIAVENHPHDSRVDLDYSGTCQTLTSRMGTGGNNIPMVMEMVAEPFCKSRRAKSPNDYTTWKCAKVANTLNTFDQGESRANELVVESMKTTKQVVNLNKDDVRSDSDHVPVVCLQGNGIDRADTANCNGKGWKEDVSYTLNTIDRPAVAYGIGRDAYNQGKNAQYKPAIEEELQPTIVAKGPGAVCIGNGQVDQLRESELVGALNCMHDQQAIITKQDYVVRRLTPLECCRLQGFPNGYAEIDHKEDFSEEECKFWNEVRQTFNEFTGKDVKEYTKEQLLKWYNSLHTDSAEYKMWGNGIALPCALYVMQGIAEVLQERE